MCKRAVIITGGHIDTEVVFREIGEYDVLIAVDKGLEFLHRNEMIPDYIVGDFDSVLPEVIRFYRGREDVQIREYQPEKDASDTEIGVRLAVELECQKIDILGATGNRIDHVWANIQVLAIPYQFGCSARIIDGVNRISIVPKNVSYGKKEMYGPYFSVFSLGASVVGLTMKGCKYPLENHELLPYDSLSVSNQVVDENLHITYDKGMLIMVEAKAE